MTEQEKELNKDKVDETTTQDSSTEEKNDTAQKEDGTSQKTEEQGGEENVTLSKKELETLRKKATDFDGIIEKRRLEKLAKKDKPQEIVNPEVGLSGDEIIEKAKEAARLEASQIVADSKKAEYESNLGSAYKEWLADNKWADSDDKIDAISQKFSPQGSVDVKSLKIQLDKAAQDVFPDEYKGAYESRIRAKVLAETGNIDAGDAGSGSSVVQHDAGDANVSAEDMRIATKYFGGDVKRYLKYKQDEANKVI